MVILKSHQAMGSFLGRGTHVWLEIHPHNCAKTTFSGAKIGRRLGIVENLKRDYDKLATRGSILIPAPVGMTNAQWAQLVIDAGRDVKLTTNKKLRFSGPFPSIYGHGNCCTVVKLIIHKAGGELPEFKPSGFAPGLCSALPA